jgi:UDP-N-acetyl-D-mannosaminuronic acid dehydrogenase
MTCRAFNKICVIGLGYVGLPTAAIFASRGVEVLGVDIDNHAVELINDGKAHFVEPGLNILVKDAVAAGKLRARTDPEPADAFIVAVPTPFKKGKKPNLKYVKAAVESLAPVLKKGDLVVIESTCPVGTTDSASIWMNNTCPNLSFPHNTDGPCDINVAHSPERVLPGQVLIELVSNDRVVGGVSVACGIRTKQLYSIAVEGECLLTSARTAELVKLSENAYRDVNIAFANELSLVCEELNIDVWEAIRLANHHPRVDILTPGPGVGGHCIAVDPWFLVDSAPKQTPLIKAARFVNDGKPISIARGVLKDASQLGVTNIACLGLSYKADIDDLRESPSVDVVVELMKDKRHTLWIVEPHSMKLPKKLQNLGTVKLSSLDDAIAECDIIVLLTDHQVFKDINTADYPSKRFIDTRGLWK